MGKRKLFMNNKHEEDSYQWIKVRFNKHGKLEFGLCNAWRSVEDMGIDGLIELCHGHLKAQEEFFKNKKIIKYYDVMGNPLDEIIK